MTIQYFDVTKYGAAGSDLEFVASGAAGSHSIKVVGHDFVEGNTIVIAGGQTATAEKIAKVKFVSGDIIMLDSPLGVNVSSAPVKHGDKTCIQMAIDAAASEGGGVVYLPKGNYYIGNSQLIMKSNVKLVGDGYNLTKIIGKTGSSTYSPGSLISTEEGSNNFSFEGITFENRSIHVGCNIFFANKGANNFSFKVCKFTGNLPNGIHINKTGIRDVVVEECYFESGAYGFLANKDAWDTQNVRIRECKFENLSADAIELNFPIEITGFNRRPEQDSGFNFIIHDNFISLTMGSGTTAGFGIGIAGATKVEIKGNIIRNVRSQGIHLEDRCMYITIEGNSISGVEDWNKTDGIPYTPIGIHGLEGDYIKIIGNNIKGCMSNGIDLGFDSSGNGIRNAIISNNTIHKCGGHGIYYGCNGESNTIISNNIINGNKGSGISIEGNSVNLMIEDNILNNNSSYGFEIKGGKPGFKLGRNMMVGNGIGDVNNLSETMALPISNKEGYASATISSTKYTPFVDILPLGEGMNGIVIARAYNGGNTSIKIFNVSWNGKMLNVTPVGGQCYGAYEVDTLGFNPATKCLTVNAYSASIGLTVNFHVKFEGTYLTKYFSKESV